jgi:glycosyltransferase involved in cell wall biosynthesis
MENELPSEHTSGAGPAATPGPLVSIGLPAFNAERTIAAVINSLLSQTHRHFELVISDNCSTDGTGEICRAFAAGDARIRYIRQPANLGATRNFQIVFEEARGDYFVWAASDDLRSPDFLEVNVGFLESHPAYGASISPVRNEGMGFNPIVMGDAPLDHETFEERVLAFFKTWHGNARYYSVFRTRLVKDNTLIYMPEFAGSDWAMTLVFAERHKFNRADRGELVLGTAGMSKSPDFLRRMRKKRIERLLPIWQLAVHMERISRGFSLRSRWTLLKMAVWLNYQANVMRWRHRQTEQRLGTASGKPRIWPLSLIWK